MRAALAVLLLSSGLAFGAGPSFWRFPPSNCATPSASCLVTSLQLSGAAPQLQSTAAATFEIRTGATGGTTGFKLYTTNNLTGTILEIGEIIAGTPTPAVTLDQSNLNLLSRGIEMFGALVSNSGGADAPMVTKGGVVSTASTSRVASAQDGFANRKLDVWAGAGGVTVPGATTGSQFTCNGSAITRLNYDTTLNTWVFCDSTAMRTLPYVIPFNGTQDVGSVPAHECTNFTIPAVGVVDADVAFCDPPAGIDTGLTADCNTGVDVIGWKVCNHTVGAIDPANGAYNARVIRP